MSDPAADGHFTSDNEGVHEIDDLMVRVKAARIHA
jgi:hypothetical protein